MAASACDSIENEVSARAVAARLRECKGPLTHEVEALIKARLRKLMPRGYKFMSSGSFWSPLLEDITDIDLMFARHSHGHGHSPGQGNGWAHGNGPSHGLDPGHAHGHAYQASVTLEAANRLNRAAGRVLQATLKYRVALDVPGGPSIEEEHLDWASCLKMIQVTSAHS
jgi:hypothetical protein